MYRQPYASEDKYDEQAKDDEDSIAHDVLLTIMM
jgi:hypothetical protein